MVSLEDVPAAKKSLGLKLIGTVAGDDATTSFAIIDNKTSRKQELYHQGEKAGEVLIKRILRNKVIVDDNCRKRLSDLKMEIWVMNQLEDEDEVFEMAFDTEE